MEHSSQQSSLSAAETVRAVTVPLLLIAVGSLFLIDYSGGPAVQKTWPILLIVWGGSWALTHALSRQER